MNDNATQNDAVSDAQDASQEALQKITQERDSYLDALQRMRADVLNKDKQNEIDRSRLVARVKEGFVTELFPVLDSFEAAFAGAAWERVDAQWRVGVEYIYQQLMQVLGDNGVVPFGTKGDVYDPHIHDLSHEIAEVSDGAVVTAVIRKGYKTKENILRPATVSII